LTQKWYLKKILHKFNINGDTNSASTPLASHFKLKSTTSPTTVEEREYMSCIPYASTVGSLMYAIVYTRPDLSKAVTIVSRYRRSWKGSLRGSEVDFRYIRGTINIGLMLEKDTMSKQECIRYVDSNYVGDLDECQSTTGYVFTLSQVPMS